MLGKCDITSICGGLNINIGTLTTDSIEAMFIAGKRFTPLRCNRQILAKWKNSKGSGPMDHGFAINNEFTVESEANNE